MPEIYVPNDYKEDKLKEVIEEMKKLGSPHIRAFFRNGYYQALEGSHRIAAAKKLGIPIYLIMKKLSDKFYEHDFDSLEGDTVKDVINYLDKNNSPISYDFEHGNILKSNKKGPLRNKKIPEGKKIK